MCSQTSPFRPAFSKEVRQPSCRGQEGFRAAEARTQEGLRAAQAKCAEGFRAAQARCVEGLRGAQARAQEEAFFGHLWITVLWRSQEIQWPLTLELWSRQTPARRDAARRAAQSPLATDDIPIYASNRCSGSVRHLDRCCKASSQRATNLLDRR